MGDRDSTAALIERIVIAARIPSRRERDDLRRELWTHFEEAQAANELRQAMVRFGDELRIAAALRRVYRWDYAALYLAKLAASIVASILAALVIELLVNVRAESAADAWRLAPGFSHAAVLAVAVALAVVTACEMFRPPFHRSRAIVAGAMYIVVATAAQQAIARSAGAFVIAAVLAAISQASSRIAARSIRLSVICALFAAAEYVMHLMRHASFSPGRAVLASAILVGVWTTSAAIASRFDSAFADIFA